MWFLLYFTQQTNLTDFVTALSDFFVRSFSLFQVYSFTNFYFDVMWKTDKVATCQLLIACEMLAYCIV